MPTSCSGLGCTNRCKSGSGIKFHRFPLGNKDLLKKWIIAMRRKDFSPNANTRICSDHFRECDYKIRRKLKVLKTDAVPSIFHAQKKVSKKAGISIQSTPKKKFSDACVQTKQNMASMNRRLRKIKTLKQKVKRQRLRIKTLCGLLKICKDKGLLKSKALKFSKVLFKSQLTNAKPTPKVVKYSKKTYSTEQMP